MKGPKLQSIKIYFLLVVAVLVSSSLCSELEKDLEVNHEEIKGRMLDTVERYGRIVPYIIKSLQMLVLVLFIVDCAARYYGKKLHLTHLMRFAIFVYGSSSLYLFNRTKLHYESKWFLKYVLDDQYELTYHAYWQSGFLNCFRHSLTVKGKPYGFNFVNILPIEILLWFLMKCGEKVTTREFARKDRWVHFWVTVKALYIQFFGFPFVVWGLLFIKQHWDLLTIERRKQGPVDGRNDIVYWMSMALALWMIYEVIVGLIDLFVGNMNRVETFVKDKPIEKKLDNISDPQKRSKVTVKEAGGEVQANRVPEPKRKPVMAYRGQEQPVYPKPKAYIPEKKDEEENSRPKTYTPKKAEENSRPKTYTPKKAEEYRRPKAYIPKSKDDQEYKRPKKSKKPTNLAPEVDLSKLPPMKDANKEDCHYLAVMTEYWFMYQHHNQSLHKYVSQFYNFIWIIRWYIMAASSVIWHYRTYKAAFGFSVLNLAMFVFTLVISGSFRRKIYFWIILAEEVLVFIWQLCLLVFIGYYKDDIKNNADIAVSTFLQQTVFWGFVFCLILELILNILPIFENHKYYRKHNNEQQNPLEKLVMKEEEVKQPETIFEPLKKEALQQPETILEPVKKEEVIENPDTVKIEMGENDDDMYKIPVSKKKTRRGEYGRN